MVVSGKVNAYNDSEILTRSRAVVTIAMHWPVLRQPASVGHVIVASLCVDELARVAAVAFQAIATVRPGKTPQNFNYIFEDIQVKIETEQ